VGDKMKAAIKSITDFGIFIGLDGNIDGLIHLSDLSWDKPGEDAVRDYKKGDEVEAVILAIDPERERISLGVKQLTPNQFAEYADAHPKNSVVTGIVASADEKEAIVTLADDIQGHIKASEFSEGEVLTVGQTVEAKIMSIDKKTRMIALSIKAKDMHDQKAALKELKQSSAPATKFGDLLKGKMNSAE
jgi:small subunit ribosomal protein S1